MREFMSEHTKVIIMLCVNFDSRDAAQVLSHKNYVALKDWLAESDLFFGDLLDRVTPEEAARATGLEPSRLTALLERGMRLGFAVETWQRHGIQVVCERDEEYPVRLKTHLGNDAPALLFGAGNFAMLDRGGLGVVGSRGADSEALDFTTRVAGMCARNGIAIVSGGARGVDSTSMKGALEQGGTTIGVVAENLLRRCVEFEARRALAEGSLLLVSPYHPEARFQTWTAMDRNKLIYALSDHVLVVSSDYKKGGTWAGAIEELQRENHRPVFVRLGDNVPAGNAKLAEKGALVWPAELDSNSLTEFLAHAAIKKSAGTEFTPSLFGDC